MRFLLSSLLLLKICDRIGSSPQVTRARRFFRLIGFKEEEREYVLFLAASSHGQEARYVESRTYVK